MTTFSTCKTAVSPENPEHRNSLKLIIQIPCFNEEENLVATLNALPRKLDGVDEIEILIVNDGSRDGTAQVARNWGVDHLINLPANRGLAKAFSVGLEASLESGADIIVNADADNQYHADDIPALLKPIQEGIAEIVVGARPITDNPNFGFAKKCMQRLGSAVVRLFSKTAIVDAPSGFRAFSRRAALQLRVFSKYTYPIETIIQAGQRGIPICSVPVRVRPPTRSSRLVRSIPDYVARSVLTILRIFILYRPMAFFSACAFIVFLPGFILGLRFLAFLFAGDGQGHIQSLILATLLMSSGILLFIVAILADLIAANRQLLEDLHWKIARSLEPAPKDRFETHPSD